MKKSFNKKLLLSLLTILILVVGCTQKKEEAKYSYRGYKPSSYIHQEKDDIYLKKGSVKYIYKYYKNGVNITRIQVLDNYKSKTLKIPSEIEGKKVIKLGTDWSDDREEAIIPNGIKKMDDYFVFNNVKKVYIPQSIKYFGEQQAIRSKKYFVVSKNNPYFFSKKGNIFLRKTGKRL